MIVCNRCTTLFESTQGVEPFGLQHRMRYKICPIRGCMGALVDIDDPLVHVLILFWQSRFETFFSCSGHFYEEKMTPYVVFGARITNKAQKSGDIDRLHEKARELLTKNRSYVMTVGDIENKHINVPYIKEPLFIRRFDIRARNVSDTYQARIETQAAFIRYLYDLHYETVSVRKEK